MRDVPEGVTRGYACHSQCEICGPEYDRYDQVGERGGEACHCEQTREREAHEYDERVGAREHVVCGSVEGYYIMAGFGLDLLALGGLGFFIHVGWFLPADGPAWDQPMGQHGRAD